ncbi:MAG: CRISPR-associated helicase Cas3' [Candidatus Accumulibacter sp.]|uniref:CRISPR-associated helicase Cas3 n=1 Tax=Candidatus Accumulibacter phosphatis TaxID=327160 RepID=A0A5S4EMA4_9PROT|nr:MULTISPECIES: CRISPR-associated helicase Cas3' [Candidatus Accumulibacter]MBN8518401.1 CRISPR-associated helicase Cas3' [Accumulibacter sp.]MBO3711382.1 CRISPR-associated helicase Cas3' [Accumulibacter sp.]MCM8578376.1 CRISPR-associated helicase Cas3' [Accumulibacter sp.]TMQ76476.1 CRISPR-associated helicase Cas3 [Candidatus Accumulibacter phosphatis]
MESFFRHSEAMYRNLLAKGWDPRSSATPPAHTRLGPHLRAAQQAAQTIADSAGITILENLDLPAQPWLPRLRLTLSLSALLHDLGKANSYFQGMVRGKPDFPPTAQPIRHELLVTLLLLRNSGGITDWLHRQLVEAGEERHADELVNTVIAAIAGHHVKMDNNWAKAFSSESRGGGKTSIDLYLSHAELQVLFGAAHAMENENWSLLTTSSSYPGKSRLPFNIRSSDWQDHLASAPDWWRFAAAVKALTVAADVAASALLPEGVSPKTWITVALRQRPNTHQLLQVANSRLRGRPLRPFQKAIADSPARITLVEAGCGSGKSVAAYYWAANRLAGRKLFFCYPTTGTASEGFVDYVADSEVEGELIHSRARVDLERVAMSWEESPSVEREDEQLRIASLNAWHPEVVVCTVDTVLALVRNNQRGLYASPAILSAGFVFDELHAYDDEMFTAVVAFIRALSGAPFLLMTASLPAQRKSYLTQQFGDLGTVEPPAELEAIRRYDIQHAISADAALQLAIDKVLAGGRVLWVCNVVARAQAIFERARSAGVTAIAYHSRFKYHDRVQRHREVVDGFATPAGSGLLAVTTQVAEMSLDLDADLLITELAPVAALIQRLGRLNRRVSEEYPGSPRQAWVITPEKASPYESADLARAGLWLDGLVALNRSLSQRDLADRFSSETNETPLRLDLRTEWLDSGWCATPGMVREPGFNVNVILPEDLGDCRISQHELIKRSLPMPYKKGMADWQRFRSVLIAPDDAIQYDQYRGAIWAE